ncbi:prohead core scaffolding protein and protease [Ochrobactrum phage vB_OspM_OC]|nr:prohead core scaffolding protein and protease [Ochrobactrum phage vB_OspM_OC]
MKLLCEVIEDVNFQLDREKGYFIEGVFLMGNRKNRNGRIYPEHVLEQSASTYIADYVSKKRAFGELDHPSNPTVNLERASHLIVDLRKEGADYIGRAKVLNTDMGKIVKAFMDEGCVLGVSSRGLGKTKDTKHGKLVESFLITTAADIVADPSGYTCFVDNIMESTEWIQKFDGTWVPKYIEESKKEMNDISKPTISKEVKEAKKLELFEAFVKNIGQKS